MREIISFQEAAMLDKPRFDRQAAKLLCPDPFEHPHYPFPLKGKIIHPGRQYQMKLPILAANHVDLEVSLALTDMRVLHAEIKHINDADKKIKNGFYLEMIGKTPGISVVQLFVQGTEERQRHELGVDKPLEIPVKVYNQLHILRPGLD